jgi:hypothetical protein
MPAGAGAVGESAEWLLQAQGRIAGSAVGQFRA